MFSLMMRVLKFLEWIFPPAEPKFKRGVTHHLGKRPHQYYVMQRQYVREKLNQAHGGRIPLDQLAWSW